MRDGGTIGATRGAVIRGAFASRFPLILELEKHRTYPPAKLQGGGNVRVTIGWSERGAFSSKFPFLWNRKNTERRFAVPRRTNPNLLERAGAEKVRAVASKVLGYFHIPNLEIWKFGSQKGWGTPLAEPRNPINFEKEVPYDNHGLGEKG